MKDPADVMAFPCHRCRSGMTVDLITQRCGPCQTEVIAAQARRQAIEECIGGLDPLAARMWGVAYRQAVRDSQRALRALLPQQAE